MPQKKPWEEDWGQSRKPWEENWSKPPVDPNAEIQAAQKAKFPTEAEKPRSGDDRTASQVAMDQALAWPRGVGKMVMGLPEAGLALANTYGKLSSGQLSAAVDDVIEMIKGSVAPVGTMARNAGALATMPGPATIGTSQQVMAPSRQETEESAEFAGQTVGGMLATPPVMSPIARAALRKVTSAESQMARAAGNRAAVSASSVTPADHAVARASGLPTPAVSIARQVLAKIYSKPAAFGQEKLAAWLANGDVAPTITAAPLRAPNAPLPGTPGLTQLENMQRAEAAVMNRPSLEMASPRGPSQPLQPSQALQDLARGQEAETAMLNRPSLETVSPSGPSQPIPLSQQLLDLVRGQDAETAIMNRPDLETRGPATPSQPLPAGPQLEALASASRVPKPPNWHAMEEKIAPSGKFAKQTSQMVDAKGKPTAFGERLLQEVPELNTAAKGLEADAALKAGFDRVEESLIKVEDKVPRTATVPKATFVSYLKDLMKEYAEVGDPGTAVEIGRVMKAWNKMPDLIPWEQFLKAKRAFYRESRSLSPAMKRVYGQLMEASDNVSKELTQANKSYSTVIRAMDNAGIDTVTGNRISNIGKAQPFKGFKPDLPEITPDPAKRRLPRI